MTDPEHHVHVGPDGQPLECNWATHLMDKKNALYGQFNKSYERNARLQEQITRKALDMPDDSMGDITSKTEHHYHYPTPPQQQPMGGVANPMTMPTAAGLSKTATAVLSAGAGGGIMGLVALLLSFLSQGTSPPPVAGVPTAPTVQVDPVHVTPTVDPVELEIKWWIDDTGNVQHEVRPVTDPKTP